MPAQEARDEEETLLPPRTRSPSSARGSLDTVSSASTTSLVFDRLNDFATDHGGGRKFPPRGNSLVHASERLEREEDDGDLEDGYAYSPTAGKPMEKKARRYICILASVFIAGWLVALGLFLSRQTYKHPSTVPHDPQATQSRGSGKKVTLDQVLGGGWRAQTHKISWIEGANGEDGLLLEVGGGSRDGYAVVEDVRSRSGNKILEALNSTTLMKDSEFQAGSQHVFSNSIFPSRDLKNVLVVSEIESYWIFNVATQSGQPLDPISPSDRIQLASWSPKSDAVIFTRDNNLFLRKLASTAVIKITEDGGTDLFYGVPDWVYEEEVFSGNSATWWADDGRFVAFLRTNESAVPEYPVQYFIKRPSGSTPPPGLENYPEVRKIKYPKAGAPNPVVDLQFYDVEKDEVFSVEIDGDFPDTDRLITEVVWAGSTGNVLVRETNRESDTLKVVLIDVRARTGRVVRTVDVNALDGGWFEVSEDTRYIPADPAHGRPDHGYIDTVVHDGYDHLAYFTPMDNDTPIYLTSGPWEVVKAPSAVDLANNVVYFIGTKESPTQRHIYSVRLNGSDLTPVTDVNKEGYYDVSFSKGAGYGLLSYNGPNIPWQKIFSTPYNKVKYEQIIEENKPLAELAAQHELPILIYQNVSIDGFTLQVVERRPPHFNPQKKYPLVFFLYNGPGSQTVSKKWNVDFQSYIAATLGYIVVSVDGRGTGFIGRKARCIIRGNIGYYEARDQIETAKIWAAKPYVDRSRLAIWGWSYGGFMTLKTLEQDGGQTFQYGMAVAPVTDWRFYGKHSTSTAVSGNPRKSTTQSSLALTGLFPADSIYTERYMHTPQHNPSGYSNSTISNTTALRSNVRFLIMHGVADDNVHMQNTLALLDKLDLAGVENYDVHFFPDSDHSIYFHNANRMVYDRLNNWLINAFNGEWLRTENPTPIKTALKRR
ncbi:hypothetical protein GP486_003978 [Trichoglossum hirsutum]|uniref:dipeptidyl-peptidase IV n=1 Tax=Trichoglossum hirsutum TaxID=265104 RepID=A0A9P8RPV8_9PEZI|nr:hypothetical protein GP486_003978 [Trichoglossum hirsutum]